MIVNQLGRGYLLRDYNQAIAHIDHTREDQDITRRDLATLCKVSNSQITEWLNGRHEPRASRLFELAHALGLDVAFIPREEA